MIGPIGVSKDEWQPLFAIEGEICLRDKSDLLIPAYAFG